MSLIKLEDLNVVPLEELERGWVKSIGKWYSIMKSMRLEKNST